MDSLPVLNDLPLPSPSPIALLATVSLALACGGDPAREAPATAETTPAEAPARTSPADTPLADEVTLLAEIPNGTPMPEASRTGGIPPYPNATVHTRQPRDRPGLRSFEAFTPDSWAVVQAHYDTALGSGWTKMDAEDTTIYERGDDQAAITLSPWNPEDLPRGVDHPRVLREARTIIGVAWRASP